MLIPELLHYIFGGKTNPVSAQFEVWLKSSRRFKDFAEQYRDKIKKKHRIVQDADGLKDLLLELETAYWFLQDNRFALRYEVAANSGRAPDFSLTFRTNTLFNVEATRVRGIGKDLTPEMIQGKLMGAVCDKVGQMPTSVVNVLVMRADCTRDDLAAAMIELRRRAEQKEEAFFLRKRFKDSGEFLRQFRHLSGIFLWETPPFLWLNSLAKHQIPDELRKALQNPRSE